MQSTTTGKAASHIIASHQVSVGGCVPKNPRTSPTTTQRISQTQASPKLLCQTLGLMRIVLRCCRVARQSASSMLRPRLQPMLACMPLWDLLHRACWELRELTRSLFQVLYIISTMSFLRVMEIHHSIRNIDFRLPAKHIHPSRPLKHIVYPSQPN